MSSRLPGPRRAGRPRRARASHDPAASQSGSGRADEDRSGRGRSRPRPCGAESGRARTSCAAGPGGSDPRARNREPRQRDGDARARAGVGLASPRRCRRAAPSRPAPAPTANPRDRAASLPRPNEGVGGGACPNRRAARRPGRSAHLPCQAVSRDAASRTTTSSEALGAWAWDEVAAALRADGHDVTALTLPGSSPPTPTAPVTVRTTLPVFEPVSTAGRLDSTSSSGSGAPGTRRHRPHPEQIAAMVYFDTGPGRGPRPRLLPTQPLPSRRGAVGRGEPRRAQRGAARDVPAASAATGERVLPTRTELTNDARLDVPSTVICTGFSSEQYEDAEGGLSVPRRPHASCATSPGRCRRATGRRGHDRFPSSRRHDVGTRARCSLRPRPLPPPRR